MVESQFVIAPPAKAALFLVCTMAPGGEPAVRDLLQDVAGLRRSVGFRAPDAKLSCVVGIGSAAWDRLFEGPRPRDLHPFVALAGSRHRAPSTPGDLLFHVRAHHMDLCFELAQLIGERLYGAVAVVDEVHGFKYFDERDLLGFVDGTENPEGDVAADAVFIGDEDRDFAGGSYVIVQKYLHALAAWNTLPTQEQEKVIGRTKLANIEMPDDIKPPDSHVALNTITDAEGNERKIVRDNMPFGSIGQREFGTYFIGYARTPEVTEQMLRNMFLGDHPHTHDRILDFSTAVTGCLFYVPSADFLDDPPAAPTGAPTTEGSLGIGSLKGA
ncbi:Dyp-type peroxidase [Streptomyces sp. NBC_01340]|uniref:Dyp-type peroxidase n=1 Tax=unclassified Streptomyces TaxID=2593676 RepID=UPI00225A124C|nr:MULTISPECIES: Dyp-type peroxidase [unclassified Streptomyces]MCX4461981.1 Dyp-type peroxidase [Streptomyces sp. NBC_01719]MCX4490889.1 Dyp-type peroxidase [Streptomyces sp. NBC_01728]MCX4594529.1 Dyp-type peroxidase [Streptomyces sp. NBC_01549]WSI36229.1 Dyp-type peroxidase [Streptomyces sp. NBC_01340]